jgi:hypothetical protein
VDNLPEQALSIGRYPKFLNKKYEHGKERKKCRGEEALLLYRAVLHFFPVPIIPPLAKSTEKAE